jgi:outer membrane protein
MKYVTKILLATVASAFFIPVVAIAQSTDGLKIGVVNINQLLPESPQFQDARGKLEDEFAPRQREIMAQQAALEEKAAKLQKDIEVMGEAERETVQRDLRNEERSLVRSQQEFREDMELRQSEIMGAVQQAVAKEVQAFGDAEGYDIILFEGVVYASERVDVTQALIERLNAAFAGKSGQ